MNPIRIAYLSTRDIENPESRGHYYMAKALARHVGELVPAQLSNFRGRSWLARAAGRLGLKWDANHRYAPIAESQRIAEIAKRRLQGLTYDAVFLPHGSAIAAHLDVDKPVIYASDATFRRMNHYYPQFHELDGQRVEEEEYIARRATERSNLLVHPTEWAAQSSVHDYGAAPEKVVVVPSGANLDNDVPTLAELRERNETP